MNELDLDAFMAVRAIAFPGAGLDEKEMRDILRKRLPFSKGLFMDGQLACVQTTYPTSMYFAGQPVPMGALAGVASAPEFRRRGLVRELLRDALDDLHEQGVGWSLEYPFDPRFYHRLGWQSMPNGVELELPVEYLFDGSPPTAYRRALSEFPSLAAIYSAWSARYSFALTRIDDPRDPWTRLVSAPWLEGDAFLYELDDAYLLLTLAQDEGRLTATVEDYAFASPDGRRDLLGLLGSLQGQVELVRIHLPDVDPLVLDFGRRFVKPGKSVLQARVVDIEAALAPLVSKTERRLTVSVVDELCPWNHGTFLLTVGTDGSSLERVDAQPDVEIPIQTLPLLLAGVLSADAALAQGQARGRADDIEAFSLLGGGLAPFLPLSDSF